VPRLRPTARVAELVEDLPALRRHRLPHACRRCDVEIRAVPKALLAEHGRPAHASGIHFARFAEWREDALVASPGARIESAWQCLGSVAT